MCRTIADPHIEAELALVLFFAVLHKSEVPNLVTLRRFCCRGREHRKDLILDLALSVHRPILSLLLRFFNLGRISGWCGAVIVPHTISPAILGILPRFNILGR